MAELEVWASAPGRVPKISVPAYVRPHPLDPYSFLHVPSNTKHPIPADNVLHPLYRPLWDLQSFLKSAYAKKTHRFWAYVMLGMEELFERLGKKTLWLVTMQKGARLPFQVLDYCILSIFIITSVLTLYFLQVVYRERLTRGVGPELEYDKTGCFVVPAAPNPRHHKGWRSLGRSNTPDLILRTIEENFSAVVEFCGQLDWHLEYVPNPREEPSVVSAPPAAEGCDNLAEPCLLADHTQTTSADSVKHSLADNVYNVEHCVDSPAAADSHDVVVVSKRRDTTLGEVRS